MKGVRGDSATPGEFRRSQNWIGTSRSTPATATYVPPPPDALADTLGTWEKFLHDRSLPPLVQAALVHSQFEAIHPFLDGNGRVGRLLITLFLIEREVLPSPLLYLSAWFEVTRQTYYDRLLGVTEAGEWEAWISYFLAGVEKQSEDALRRTAAINQVLAGWHRKVAGQGSAVAPRAVDLLAENPFWTAKGAARRLDVAITTAQRVLESLEALGIVVEITAARRDRVYCARKVLRILEAPAQLGTRTAAP
jgi:Fic family protein